MNVYCSGVFGSCLFSYVFFSGGCGGSGERFLRWGCSTHDIKWFLFLKGCSVILSFFVLCFPCVFLDNVFLHCFRFCMLSCSH